LNVSLWQTDHAQGGALSFGLRQAQVILLVAKGTREDKVFVRAASLALVTLLSVVPFLAVVFSIVQAVGGLSHLRESLMSYIYENLAVGSDSRLISWLNGLITNIHGGAIGGVGIVVLLWASFRLLIATEAAFDEIWGVRRKRSLLHRLVVYWSLLTLGPVMLGLSLVSTATLRGWLGEGQLAGLARLLNLVPACLSIGGLGLLYLVLPNTRVKLRHAMLGGLVAGLLFELAKWGYAWVATNLFSYNAIYGSLGVIPVFIIWVNIAWLIILFGCELSFANQNVRTLRLERQARNATPRTRELLASRLMLEVARAFASGKTPPTADECAQCLGAPVRLSRELLDLLRQAELCREAKLGLADAGWLPARALNKIKVSDVVEAVRSQGGEEFELSNGPGSAALKNLQEKAESVAGETLASLHFEKLLESEG